MTHQVKALFLKAQYDNPSSIPRTYRVERPESPKLSPHLHVFACSECAPNPHKWFKNNLEEK